MPFCHGVVMTERYFFEPISNNCQIKGKFDERFILDSQA